MDCFSVFNPSCLLISSLFFSLSFISHFSNQNSCSLSLSLSLSLSFRYGYMRGFDCFNLPLSLLVNINQCIIVTASLKTKRWTQLSYYSPGYIARWFDDRQGVLNDDGIFHISIFTEGVLGIICETWLKRMVTKDICFLQFLHPTSGYKTWLTWGRFVWKRKITKSPTKERGLTDYLDMS